MASRAHLGLAVLIAAIAASGGACTCSKGSEPASADGGETPAADGGDGAASSGEARDLDAGRGLSAPIAAARSERGEVVVAALDVAARAIRVQRISAKDEVL